MQRTGHSVARLSATDRSLLSRARDGDVRAFETIVGSRLPRVYRLADGILGDRDAAADAALNAVVAAWHELPRLEDVDRFDDWLDRVVLSECHMRLVQAGGGRAAAEMPEDLVDRTLRAVAAEHRANHGGAGWRAGVGARGRLALRGALVIAVPVLAVALLGAGGAFRSPFVNSSQKSAVPSAPAESAVAQATASVPPTGTPPGGTPPSTGETAGSGLEIGKFAMVTLEGGSLRVRTTPGTSDPKTRLSPTLPAGTRMLLVGGPVAADGYDWYQVRTDGELIDMFGWVAAGKDGEAWIVPVRPHCWGGANPESVAGLNRVDFLACYGATEVKVWARAGGLWDLDHDSNGCGWVRDGGACDTDLPWLLLPSARITLITDSGAEHDITVAMPPELAEALDKVPRQPTLLLTLSMDAPESSGCGIRDEVTGEPLLEKAEAVTACRLQFVVQEVAFRDPGASPTASP